MKKTGLVLFLPLICIIAMGQQNHAESNELSIGLPVLFNKTTVTNVFGPARSISGTGLGYGLSVQYKRYFTKNVYAKLGLGFFAQNFSLRRPYQDDDFVSLLRTTRKYSYHCFDQLIGVGYTSPSKGKYAWDVSVNYHFFKSYRQQYNSRGDQNITVTKYQYQFGQMLTILPSLQRKLSEKMRVSAGLVLPLNTLWHKDPRFYEDRNDRYGPSLHIGLQLGVHYRF